MKRLIMSFLATLLISTGSHATTVFIVGDSTASIKAAKDRPETGWGEAFKNLLPENIALENVAKNGRSTRSFVAEGRWQAVVDQLNAGDIVLIQFGHNDQKLYDRKRFTDPWRDYPQYLRTFVEDTRAKGAHPVLITPIARRKFDKDGNIEATHRPYPEVVREMAKNLNAPLIDANTFSRQWLLELGNEASKNFFLHLPPSKHPNYPDGIADDTHLNPNGALVVATFVADELKKLTGPYSVFSN